MDKSFQIKRFYQDGQRFFKNLVDELELLGIPATSMSCDHLCFRVETEEQYLEYKAHLTDHGTLLTEANVNGRPISTFLLHEPFCVGRQSIPMIELPAPKMNSPYILGFEHAEFVITESFDIFSKKFPALFFRQSGNQNFNSELCLKSKEGQVKFHYHPLDRIIEIESATIADIVFDFDGTIIKSRDAIFEINRRVFSEVLNREVSLEEAKQKFHPEFVQLFRAFGVVDPIRKKRAVAAWGEASADFKFEVFDGVLELLARLEKSQCRLHLWTARDETSAREILKYHNIETIFETLSFASENVSKPHQNSLKFDWALAPKNSVLVVGDSPTDIVGAKNIGAISAAAMWDPHAREDVLIAAGAELYFRRVDEFERWLSQMGLVF